MKLRSLALLCSSVALAGVSASAAPGSSIQDRPAAQHENELVRGTLPNGLNYLFERRPGQPVVVRLGIRTGYLTETREEAGLSHLIEHRAFSITRHFKLGELKSMLKREFNGSVMGATGSVETRLGMTADVRSDDDVPELMKIVRDWADGIVLDEASVRRESRIQRDEWQGTEKYDAERKTLDKILSSKMAEYQTDVYRNLHGFRRGIAKQYYDRWYRPSLMSLVVVGDLDPHVWEANAIRALSDLRDPLQPANPFVPAPTEVQGGERLFMIYDRPNSPIMVRTFTLSKSLTRAAASQRELLIGQVAQYVIIARASALDSQGFLLDAGDGTNVLVPGVHQGLYLLSPSKLEDLRKTVAVHDGFVRSLISTKVDPAELAYAKRIVRDQTAVNSDTSRTAADYYVSAFLFGIEPQAYQNVSDLMPVIDGISLSEVQRHIDGLVAGPARTGISGPKDVLAKLDLTRIASGIGTFQLPTSKPAYAELMPQKTTPAKAPVPYLRARLPMVSANHTILPGGIPLTSISTGAATSQSTSLKIIGKCSGNNEDLQPASFKFSGSSPSIHHLDEALQQNQIKAQAQCANGHFTLTLDSRTSMAVELFDLASRVARDPRILRWGLASNVAGNAAATNKPVGQLLGAPSHLLFVGNVTPTEIETIAWNSFVRPLKERGSHFIPEHGSKIKATLTNIKDGIKLKSRLAITLPTEDYQKICWDIMRDMMSDKLYYDMRLDKGISYNPRYVFSESDEGAIHQLNFDMVVDSDDPVRIQKLSAWRAFVKDLPRRILTREQFETSRLAMSRAALAAPASALDSASFIRGIVGEKTEAGPDPFGAEQVTFEEVAGLVKAVSDSLARDRPAQGRR